MQNQQSASSKVKETCDAFQSVLKINPECYPALLYQVDMYGMLPPEMGGDRQRAELIAGAIKSKTFGAMAKARLLADTADQVAYWQNVMKETGTNAQVLEELGRAFLFKSNDEQGKKYFMNAINADPAKAYLTMNLARYFVMKSQQDQANRDNHLKTAGELVNTYMQADPDLVPPLKAHAYAMLAMISSIGNDQDSMNKYMNLATSIDPFCSKASGMPSDILFYPPDKVKISYTSLFLPF
jgi:tetratricopeptide (TPR) repeat protein